MQRIISEDLEPFWSLIGIFFSNQDNNVFRRFDYLVAVRTVRPNTDPSQHQKNRVCLRHYLELVPKELKKVNEQDIITFIRAPIFNKVFNVKNIVCLNTGETITKQAISSKQDLYHNKKSVAELKINLKASSDINNQQVDFAAKENSESKLYHDNLKLVLEVKDALDH